MIKKRYSLTERLRQHFLLDTSTITIEELDKARTKFDCIKLLAEIYSIESNVVELTAMDYKNLEMVFHAYSMPNFAETSYLNKRVVLTNEYLSKVKASPSTLSTLLICLMDSYNYDNTQETA